MSSDNDKNDWQPKALAYAVFGLLAVGVLLLLTPLVLLAPEAIVVLCFYLAPPLFLMAVVLMGRLAMECGCTGACSDELGRLLEQKRGGALKRDSRSFWQSVLSFTKITAAPAKKPIPPGLAHHVQAAPAAVQTPGVAEVLDRLVDWNRHQARINHSDAA